MTAEIGLIQCEIAVEMAAPTWTKPIVHQPNYDGLLRVRMEASGSGPNKTWLDLDKRQPLHGRWDEAARFLLALTSVP